MNVALAGGRIPIFDWEILNFHYFYNQFNRDQNNQILKEIELLGLENINIWENDIQDKIVRIKPYERKWREDEYLRNKIIPFISPEYAQDLFLLYDVPSIW